VLSGVSLSIARSDTVQNTDAIATENAANSSTETNASASEVEYEPVEYEDCIKIFCAKTEIDRKCSYCEHPRATMATGFLTLPDVLVVTASRFVLKNWVPTKLGKSLCSTLPLIQECNEKPDLGRRPVDRP